MIKKIDEFMAEVRTNGLAKLNRFEFNLTTPRLLTQLENESSILPFDMPISTDLFKLRRIRLYCENVSIPGMSLATNEHRTYGEKREMPYETLYEPITATFFCDTNLDVKKWFDSWQMNIVNPNTRQTRYYDDYVTEASIDVENGKDQVVYTVEISELYPKSISEIKVDLNNKDIMKFDVTFAYKYWRGYQKQPLGPISLGVGSVPGNYFRDFKSFQKGLEGIF